MLQPGELLVQSNSEGCSGAAILSGRCRTFYFESTLRKERHSGKRQQHRKLTVSLTKRTIFIHLLQKRVILLFKFIIVSYQTFSLLVLQITKCLEGGYHFYVLQWKLTILVQTRRILMWNINMRLLRIKIQKVFFVCCIL